MDQTLVGLLHWTTRGIEVAGIVAIVLGAFFATIAFLRDRFSTTEPEAAFKRFRSSLGRSILLGLEFLVAADIINTVAIEPSVEGVLVLGGIVIIRTFLSFALEVEIDGRFPWQK